MAMTALPATARTCVLFDLDGTLLDTAPDMARALNRLRLEAGMPALPFERIRPMVSHGTLGMLQLGFGLSPEDPAYHDRRQRFLDLYSAALAVETVLFPGMATTLACLEARGIPWGVVTNKPGWLTEPLLDQLNLLQRAACVVSGDTTLLRKPHPEPLLHACRLVGIAPERCWYVGDAERDILAGNRAGMRTLVARFGYLHTFETPEVWGADGLIDTPEELLAWLDQAADTPAIHPG